MAMRPLVRPLYLRGTAFHDHPASRDPRVRARLDREEHDGERKLSGLLAAARDGHFRELSALIPLLHEFEDDSFWGRASLLLSYAAPSTVLREFLRSFSSEIFVEKDVVRQCFVEETLLNSGLLWTATEALGILAAQDDRETAFSLPFRLSLLLEEEPGPIFDGPGEIPEPGPWPDWYDVPLTYDDAGYVQTVRALYAERLDEVGGNENAALFLGKPIDIEAMARDLLMNVGRVNDDEQLDRRRAILEAQTGVDLSGMFRENLALDRTSAAAALEEIFHAVELREFRPGRRYFFGRPVDGSA